MIMLGIELHALVRLLRDHRFQENVITIMIALAAVASLSRESRARNVARLIAWDKRRS
jgi:hypothetical protein